MFLFSSRRRHTRCALVTGVQTCALPIWLQPRRSTVRYKTNDVLTVGGNDTADAASLPSHRVRTLRPAHHNLHIRSGRRAALRDRSEEHTSELQSLMRISYAVFCLTKKIQQTATPQTT